MNSTDAVSNSRYASGQSLEISQIEQELQRLWKDAGETSAKSGGGAVVRACSMSLIAACSNDVQFEHVANTVEQAAMRQPCRAILVRVDLDQRERELEANVSTICSLGGPQQKRVCHEQIQLFSSAGAMNSVASTVLALLVPDVPAYLWAPCEKLINTQMIEELAGHADALLLDSHRFSEPFRALDRASIVARNHRANRAIESAGASLDAGHGFGILDLEWVRLRPWFAATAAAFENPEAQKIITDIYSLKIEYTSRTMQESGAAHRTAAPHRELITPALYAGWFASRLGWAREGRNARFTPVSADLKLEKYGARHISLVPRFDHDRSGSILNIEITSKAGRVVIDRPAGAELGTIQFNHFKNASGALSQITARFVHFNDTDILSQALIAAPRDIAFEDALPVALSFAPK
ncbi:MAG: glucose-6-phosphate dehydrogenase assembly protein OpcA [Planctomycetota bacterium]